MAPFVGRARELAAAEAFARQGGRGVLLVCGDPGSGKSRFLREVAARVPSAVRVLDDLHRADEATLASLPGVCAIAAVSDDADAAVLAAVRAAGPVQVLDLPPMADDEVRAMLADAPPGIIDAIVSAARGNPGRAMRVRIAMEEAGVVAVSRAELLDMKAARAAPFDAPSLAVAFMKVANACVLRHRVYPQWCRAGDHADRDVFEAARRMLADGRPRTIAVQTPVLCVDDVRSTRAVTATSHGISRGSFGSGWRGASRCRRASRSTRSRRSCGS